MEKKLFTMFMMVLLAMAAVGVCGCDSDSEVNTTTSISDESTDSVGLESYICGTIQLFNHEELGKYVFIDKLIMPKGDDKYSFIKTVVVPKDEFPLLNYHTGDIIHFIIVEVESEFPPIRDAMHSYPPSTEFLCKIEIYK